MIFFGNAMASKHLEMSFLRSCL